MNRAAFARSIKDPDKMLNYIYTGLSYINACKMRLNIDKMRFEMGFISDLEFKAGIHDTLQKIIHEVIDIKIYTSSELFKTKHLSNVINEKKESAAPESNDHTLPEYQVTPIRIDETLDWLLQEIRTMIHYKEYSDLLNTYVKVEHDVCHS